MFLYISVQKKGFTSAFTISCFSNSSLPSTPRIPPLLNNYDPPSSFQSYGHSGQEKKNRIYTHSIYHTEFTNSPNKMSSNIKLPIIYCLIKIHVC